MGALEKGMSEGRQACRTIVRPVLGRMLLSVLAQSNSVLGALLGGTVLVEVIFGVPGLGRTMVLAIVEDESFMALTLALLYTLN
jgi:ABC-type dipeptide/oligopeptide/nickel transport system permease component